MNYSKEKIELEKDGYSILDNIYSDTEVNQILTCIDNTEQNEQTFLKTNDLFAIRQLLQTIPELKDCLFNQKIKDLLYSLFDSEYFLTKAIYFDKPSDSNWFVAYHQDLSISVDRKVDYDEYINWTFKKGQYGVQPPSQILKDTVTLRIHLDDTDISNGALKVIPNSHLDGITRLDSIDLQTDLEKVCNVKKGGVMLMKPLTFHASNRSTGQNQRRVIHLEFNKHKLTKPLEWLEYDKI